MVMKKNISKALAMTVMMSVLAGQAYADSLHICEPASHSQGLAFIEMERTSTESRAIYSGSGMSLAQKGVHSEYENGALLFYTGNLFNAYNGEESIRLTYDKGLELGGKDITYVNDITASGTIKAGTSGEIKSGETALVTGGAVYSALQGKQDKLTETQLANLNADHSKYLTEHQDISGKADKATSLAGYGITDAYTKSETDAAIAAATYDDTAIKADIAKKADKATSLAGYGITDAYTKTETDTELAKKANQADLNAEETARKDADANLQSQIDAIGSGSSAGMAELNNKINATNDRVDRVGATAAALAGINYQPMAKGQSQVAIGMGGYKGKKATALGLAYQISDRISGSVAGAANGSERMFNVGFNYLFGQHSDKDIAQMATAPGSVSLKEAELQAQVDSLNNKVAQLEAMVKALAAK